MRYGGNLPKAENGYNVTNPNALKTNDSKYGMSIPTADGTGYYTKFQGQTMKGAMKNDPISFDTTGMGQNLQLPSTKKEEDIPIMLKLSSGKVPAPKKEPEKEPETDTETDTGVSASGDKWLAAGSAVGPLANAAFLAADIAAKPEKVKRVYDNTAMTKMRLNDQIGRRDMFQTFAAAKEGLGGRNINTRNNNIQTALGKIVETAGDYTTKIDTMNRASDIAHEDRISARKVANNAKFDAYNAIDSLTEATRKNAIRADAVALADTTSSGIKNIGDIKNQHLTNEINFGLVNSMYSRYKLEGESLKDFKTRLGKGEPLIEFKAD